ncbi:hypothetical protein GBAR_LOCUS8503 [Geodia barretti]|nr:hypothetical protein GBAR_LOCUS8503 [Geodia barretti]
MQALLLLVCVLGFAGTEVCPVVTSGSVCKISLSPPCTFDLTDSPCDVLNITLEDSTNGSCIWRWKPDDSTNFQPASATSGPRFLSLDVSYVFEQANMELTIICRSSDAILGSIKFLLPAGKPTTQLVPQLTTKPPAAGPGKPTTPLVPQLTTKPPAGDSSLSSRGFSSTPSPPTGGAVPPPHLPPHIISELL